MGTPEGIPPSAPSNQRDRRGKPAFWTMTISSYIRAAIAANPYEAAQRGLDTTALERWTGVEYTTLADTGELVDVDDAAFCEASEEYVSETETVYVGGYYGHCSPSEEWGKAARDCDAFWCDWRNEWFSAEDFTAVECEGDTVCLEANEYTLYYWESDSDYHSDPEPEPEGRASYHDGRHKAIKESWAGLVGYGRELECWVRDAADFVEAVAGGGLLLEADSSLESNAHGIEVIGAPFSLADYRAGKTDWREFYARVSCDGVHGHDAAEQNGGEGMYGEHISASAALFSNEDHIGRFVAAINAMPTLSRCIAQRDHIYSSDYRKKSVDEAKEQRGKYYPVAIHRRDDGTVSHLECRIFRSNVREDRSISRIAWLDCLRHFTSFRPNEEVDMGDETSLTREFLTFLTINKAHWPEVSAYLAEKDFGLASIAWHINKNAHSCIFQPLTNL